MKTDPNEPAFATSMGHDGDYIAGLTKREYFAAIAMQGLCANAEQIHQPYAVLAKQSIEVADALIAELNKEAV